MTSQVFNLLVDPKEEHGMLPLNQPYAPVLLAAATKHLTTMLFSSFRIS